MEITDTLDNANVPAVGLLCLLPCASHLCLLPVKVRCGDAQQGSQRRVETGPTGPQVQVSCWGHSGLIATELDCLRL